MKIMKRTGRSLLLDRHRLQNHQSRALRAIRRINEVRQARILLTILFKRQQRSKSRDRRAALHRFAVWTTILLASIGITLGLGDWAKVRIPPAVFIVLSGAFGANLRTALSLISEKGVNALPTQSATWRDFACLSVAGAAIGLVVYVMLVAQMVEGSLIPRFHIDPSRRDNDGFIELIKAVPDGFADAAKCCFWAMIGGLLSFEVVKGFTVLGEKLKP